MGSCVWQWVITRWYWELSKLNSIICNSQGSPIWDLGMRIKHTILKFRGWLANYKPSPVFVSKVLWERTHPCLPLDIVFGWFHAIIEELSGCHIDLWSKSLEYYYLVLYRKDLPTSAYIDTAWVFEQMLAWLMQKRLEIWNMSFFPPGLSFPLSWNILSKYSSLHLWPWFWRGLGRNKDGVGCAAGGGSERWVPELLGSLSCLRVGGVWWMMLIWLL